MRLLERSDQLERLRAEIEEAATGRVSLTLIEGAAGVGKTSLLEAAREFGASAGLRVLGARAGPLEGDLAWNVVRQLFGEVSRAGDEERAELLSGAGALALPALGLT